MSIWQDKTWLITGASTGFGRAAVETIVRRGGRVVATARDVSSLTNLADAFPRDLLALTLDVTRADQVRETVERVDAWGGIDVLLNNAGYGFLGGVEESSLAEIGAQMAVNFFGPLHMIRALLPGLRRRGTGAIVNMSSISGARGYEGAGFYAASKFALEGLSDALAEEVAPFGIKVLVVQPGYFRTDFSTRSLQVTTTPSEHYPHLAKRRVKVAAAKGTEPGDPTRAIAAIIAALDAPASPRRLALGGDAYSVVDAVLQNRLAELQTWKKLTQSTDFTV